MKDYTGKKIELGQKVTMDSGHSKLGEWEGEIIKKNEKLCFRYKEDGDEVELTEYLCSCIEIKST